MRTGLTVILPPLRAAARLVACLACLAWLAALPRAVAQTLKSAQLDGAGSFTVSSPPELSGSITIEAWVRPRSHANWARIVDYGTANNKIMLLASSTTTGRPVLYIDIGGSNVLNLSAPDSLPLNEWSHVAGVLNADRTAQLYVNGRWVASGTATGTFTTGSSVTAFLGKSRNSADVLLDGSIADVRIWNSARTQAQIQASMPVGSITGATTGLVAAYPFGATGAAALDDVSGNARTLTQTGTATINNSGPLASATASVNTTTAADLNSVGWLTLPSIPSLGSAATLEAWVYLTAHQEFQKVIDLSSSGSDGIYLTFSAGKPVFHVKSGSSVVGGAMPDSAIPLNAWTHLAAVIAADRSMNLYVNGVLVRTSTSTVTLPSVTRPTAYIGESSDAAHPLLAGSVADVRIWNVARTQAQIQAALPLGSITGATSGLVAAYPFGATGAAALADVSGNSRTLTAGGTVQFDVSGPSFPVSSSSNNAVTAVLDGAGWFQMPALPAQQVFTVEGWVNPKSHAGFGRIVDLGNPGYPNDNILLMYGDGTTTKPVFWVFWGNQALYSQITAPNPIPLNTWSHIAGTIGSDASMKLYVNGQLVASGTATYLGIPTAAFNVARSACRIGANHDLSGIFNGSIADVRVWNTVRTEAQIQASMPVGSITGATTGLVAAYPLGATGSSVLADVSGNSRTLAQVGTVGYRKSGSGTLSGTFSGIGAFRYYRFIATALRGGATADAIQLSEFQMLRNGNRLSGATASNPGGNNTSTDYDGSKANDDNLISKWFDSTKTSPLVLDFGTPVVADAYRLGTAGDVPNRDPISWRIEGSLDNSVWVTLDTRSNYAITTSRSTYTDSLSMGSSALGSTLAVSSGTLTLAGANTHSGVTTISNGILQVGNGGATGDLGSGNVVNNSLLVFNRTGVATFANAISGTGSLLKRGSGTIGLTGASTYSGVTTISEGSLEVGDGATAGSIGAGNVVNYASLVLNRSDNVTFPNAISGPGSLSKYGSGTATLTAANSYSGATTIGAGTLALSGSGSLGNSGAINVVSGATLDVTGRSSEWALTTSQSLANMSGSGTLRGNINASSGTLSLTSIGTMAPFTVSAGTVTLSSGTTVRVNRLISAMTVGNYKLISKSGSGQVAGVAPSSVVVEGSGIAPGLSSVAQVTGGELILAVRTPATVTLGSLQQSYDGNTHSITTTTQPAGLSVAVTYNGSATLPVNAGSYTVVATIEDATYSGTATGTLVISKAATTIQLGSLIQSYDGTARTVVATTVPPGLAWSATYNGSPNAPTNVGSYAVIAAITDVNYSGVTSGVLSVRSAAPGTRLPASPNPPSYLNHQGYLADSAGTPLGSPNPRNYELVFRIYAQATGGTSLWTERQTAALDQGRYSVMLGEGANVGAEPLPPLNQVMGDGDGTERHLEVTVRGIGLGGTDVTMMPRFRLLSLPYAFLARHARTADSLVGSNGVTLVRVSGNSIGINVEQPNAGLDVGGTLSASTLATPGNATVNGVLTAQSFVGKGIIPLGGIVAWAGTTPPQGWALCDGQTVQGRRTPDLRGRFVVGQGSGTGLTPRSIGQVGGSEWHVLGLQHLAAHTHVFDPVASTTSAAGAHSHAYSSHAVGAGFWPMAFVLPAGSDTGTHHGETTLTDNTTHRHPVSINGTSSSVGGGQAHNGMPPFYVLAYIMRVQ